MNANTAPAGPAPSFPWKQMMQIGFGVLRLSPQQFWSMTPRELASATRGACGLPASLSPPARRDLTALMHRFPDNEAKTP